MSGPATSASAPGKLVLAGEYAVVRGDWGLVVAVPPRAVARAAQVPPTGSAVLDAVASELARRYGDDSVCARRARAVAVDTQGFYGAHGKLGLGSSAAVAVAAVAYALGAPVDHATVFACALGAHQAAQAHGGGHPGSGVDIAAATYGGVLRYRLGAAGPEVRPTQWPTGAVLLPFAIPRSASTPASVRRVFDRQGEPAIARALATLASTGLAAGLACDRDDALALRHALTEGGRAIDALGLALDIDLTCPSVRALRDALRGQPVAVKTAGAGGGDVGFVLAPRELDRRAITHAITAAGCAPLAAPVPVAGVDIGDQPA